MYDTALCQIPPTAWLEADVTLSLTDRDTSTCATLPDPQPSYITYRLTRTSGTYQQPVIVTISGDNLLCHPGGVVTVVTGGICPGPYCDYLRHCVQMYTGNGRPCSYRCSCDHSRECATFYLHARPYEGHTPILCEVDIK